LLLMTAIVSTWADGPTVDRRFNLAPCGGTGPSSLKYLQGDALTGSTDCLGPDGQPYPRESVNKVVPATRRSRSSKLIDPIETQRNLLQHYEAINYGAGDVSSRQDRSLLTESPTYFGETQSRRRPVSDVGTKQQGSCSGPGNRLCRTRYNTTAPLYGVSLTSGQPVTIVQKFPDLLQQVIFEVCDSKECDVVHGECVQTYVPYLFLVIPLGPVTLTGQDYVLVENGCVCRPKYAKGNLDNTVTDALPGFGLP